MSDRGLSLSLTAIHRQLAAMPWERYLIRLIHHHTRRAFPGSRLWTAAQLQQESIVKFLRARNRDGYDVYFQPTAFPYNAGYILVDLDQAEPKVLETMCGHGHQPCVVIETSPGHLQAWVRISAQTLPAVVASAIGRQLARLYQGDCASTDWRHLGRLAGFTNQKPHRRLPGGLAPWVQVRQASLGLARNGRSLLRSAWCSLALSSAVPTRPPRAVVPPTPVPPALTAPAETEGGGARAVYQIWLHRLRIPQRFPHPDWSIADLWVAKELLLSGLPAAGVKTILQLGSPEFPRRHTMPEEYLQRTLTRASAEIAAAFPAHPIPNPLL
jgi:RepB DNA-primase from phage plasmid